METITVIRMDKSEFSELLHQAIREELQNLLNEINSKGIDDTVLNRKDACKLLDISQVTLQKIQNAGKIPYYRIGRRVLYKKADLLKAIEVKTISNRKRTGSY